MAYKHIEMLVIPLLTRRLHERFGLGLKVNSSEMKGCVHKMATQEERITNLEKRARTTDENLTILLGTIGEQGRDIKTLVAQGKEHNELLKSIETAIQLLSGNIVNMRTELLVIKALVQKEEE